MARSFGSEHNPIPWIGEQAGYFRQRHFGWDRGRVRRGRPGLAGSAPSGLVAVGIPAANSLSRIFVRIGNGLNGPVRLELRFLLNYVVAKHESYFSHGSGLVCIHAIGAEDVARRVVDRMNPRK